jgi:hypothetical protein
MTPPTTWAAGAVLTGLLAAGIPSTAAADGTPHPPTADAIAQSADAISKCLTDNGYPPLPASSVLTPVPAGQSGSLPAITIPGVGGVTTPAGGAGTTTTVATTPAAGTTSGGGAVPAVDPAGALQCGRVIVNNNLYLVTVTTTTTTTDIQVPPAVAPPTATAPAIGRPLNVRGGASPRHKRPARSRRAVRVRLSGRTGHAKRVMRVRRVPMGYATRG